MSAWLKPQQQLGVQILIKMSQWYWFFIICPAGLGLGLGPLDSPVGVQSLSVQGLHYFGEV